MKPELENKIQANLYKIEEAQKADNHKPYDHKMWANSLQHDYNHYRNVSKVSDIFTWVVVLFYFYGLGYGFKHYKLATSAICAIMLLLYLLLIIIRDQIRINPIDAVKFSLPQVDKSDYIKYYLKAQLDYNDLVAKHTAARTKAINNHDVEAKFKQGDLNHAIKEKAKALAELKHAIENIIGTGALTDYLE